MALVKMTDTHFNGAKKSHQTQSGTSQTLRGDTRDGNGILAPKKSVSPTNSTLKTTNAVSEMGNYAKATEDLQQKDSSAVVKGPPYYMPYRVSRDTVTHCTPCIAATRHPQKGMIVFATKFIPKGAIVARRKIQDLNALFLPNIWQYRMYLNTKKVEDARSVISHTIPTGNGQIMIPDESHWGNFFNHSDFPNVMTESALYTKSKWNLVALRDIHVGDELCLNYNKSSGYEVRGNEQVMRDFLRICAEYNVEKRPSKLSLPPLKIQVVSSRL